MKGFAPAQVLSTKIWAGCRTFTPTFKSGMKHVFLQIKLVRRQAGSVDSMPPLKVGVLNFIATRLARR